MHSTQRISPTFGQASSQPLTDRLAYTYEEAAHLLGISPRSVWSLVHEGKLRAVRLGKRSVRISRAEIELFLSAPMRLEEHN